MDDDARMASARWLCSSPDAIGVAVHARAQHPGDPLASAAAARRALPDLPPDQLAAALEQAELRQLARDRYGIESSDLLLTRDGLEQATRPEVAGRRARMLRAAGAARVLDLTGGLGFDAAACVAEGLEAIVIERDPATAAYLQHNIPSATVVCTDATLPGVLEGLLLPLSPDDVVFVDPARRDPDGPRDLASARRRPERDPNRWSPPWPFVAAIAHPRVAAKVAPGFTPPTSWHAEWVSAQRTIVECSVYSWPLFAAHRRAVLLDGGAATVIDADADADMPVAREIGQWLHEPDPAVVRAGALATLAEQESLALLDRESSWLTGTSAPHDSPARRSYRFITLLSGSTKQQRRQLTGLGVRRLTVKSRDVDVDPTSVLRRLDRAEGPEHVLILTHMAGRVVSLLAEPSVKRSA